MLSSTRLTINASLNLARVVNGAGERHVIGSFLGSKGSPSAEIWFQLEEGKYCSGRYNKMPATATKRKHSQTWSDSPKQKTKRPVTGVSGNVVKPQKKSQEVEEEEVDVMQNEVNGMEDEEMDEHDEQIVYQAPAGNGNATLSNNSREAHKAQKELAKERRAQRPNADLLARAKKLWEKLRVTDVKPEERKKLMLEMMELITGKVKEVIFKHDASRIVQSCVKYGNGKQREVIASELKGHYVELSKSSYGHFMVSKLLHHCPTQRSDILSEFHGQVAKLIRHQFASQVLEDAYTSYANAHQRFALIQEFYGPEFRHFKSDSKAKSLDDILAEKPEKKEMILQHLHNTLSSLLDKSLIHYAIVHRALLDYMQHADESGRKDMIEQLKEHTADIVHTAEGSRVARICFLYGSAKDRKALIKSLKTFVAKIAKDDEGHKVLLTVFDVVDDTVLVGKSIISELVDDLEELVTDKFARRVIVYLLVGRSKRYLSKEDVDSLAADDAIREATSKKDSIARRDELLAYIAPDLIRLVENQPAKLLRETLASQVLTETMLYAPGDKSAAVSAIVDVFHEADIADEENILRLSWAARSVKALFQGGHWNVANKEPDVVAPHLNFASAFIDQCEEKIPELAADYGSFVVLAILEGTDDAVKGKVQKILKPHVKELKAASEAGNKGAGMILQKL